MTSDIWASAFTDLKLNGTGPAYMDCSGASPEDLEHMRWAMRCEGLTALLDYMDKEGIDPGRHAVEFGQYEANLCTASKSTSTAKAISAACSRRAT